MKGTESGKGMSSGGVSELLKEYGLSVDVLIQELSIKRGDSKLVDDHFVDRIGGLGAAIMKELSNEKH